MSEEFRAIVVDDEESARNILKSLVQRCNSNITIVDSCENLETAVKSINKLKPDLVFLDIEMPNYSGYEITSFFENIDFEIIFITAYDNYAIKAFEVSALDYLLKPIEVSRLEVALDRFVARVQVKTKSLNYQVLKDSLREDSLKKIIVPHQGGQRVLELKDVIAMEASESYTIIKDLGGRSYMMSKNLKYFENLLEKNDDFVRVHKSWIINKKHMVGFSSTNLSITLKGDITAKLSKYKKQQFEGSNMK